MAAPEYWFPAKRYGWGWGPPRVAYAVVLCAALIAICSLKGEPPRWRWGKK